jgi:hypothetical protein
MLKQRPTKPCRNRFRLDSIPRPTMVRSSPSSLRNGIALSVLVLSLSACSQPRKPDPPPQVIQCLPPTVSPDLLIPPPVVGINDLLSRLGLSALQLTSVGTPSSDSQPSKPK